MSRKIEIMAPAGSFEALEAAIQGGADSVYFGVEGMNMRAGSSYNFTVNDLKAIVLRASECGLKTYLAVNSVIFDDEMATLHSILDAACHAGVSAVIAGDIAAITAARAMGIEVHISTQANITNLEAVRFYAAYADVVVLAREMNLEQVAAVSRRIREENICGPSGVPLRLEMFVHGALCMAVSGKCYLSLHQMNASANRGRCMQICRRGYRVTDRETGDELAIDNAYIMSPKDLKTVHFLNKIIDAGVTVLKIEGRARAPEYVRTVTACYREAVDACLSGTLTDARIAEWDRRLAAVFNRGFWNGYYLGQRLGEWSHRYGSQATERKQYLGRGMNYFPAIGVAEFKMETGTLAVGDKILVTGPTTGAQEAIVAEIRVDLQPVAQTVRGELFSTPLPFKVRASDKLYKIVAAEVSQ
jgi:putative protease